MSFFLSLAFAASCQNYSVKCQCGPAVPFEGYQVYVVENCDGVEDWHTQYGMRQFSTMEDCEKTGIAEDKVCQDLPKEY